MTRAMTLRCEHSTDMAVVTIGDVTVTVYQRHDCEDGKPLPVVMVEIVNPDDNELSDDVTIEPYLNGRDLWNGEL